MQGEPGPVGRLSDPETMKRSDRMIVVGVTGSVGTGKSTVSRVLRDFGAAVVDADAIARDTVDPKTRAWREVVRAFGKKILNVDGTIDRSALAAIVFASPTKKRKLEKIIHPHVLRQMRQALSRLRKEGWRVVVLDIPLLFETGAHRMTDLVIVVAVPRGIQYARLKAKYRWSKKEVDARIQSQWPLSAKVALADAQIDNSQSVAHTRKQVKELWNKQIKPVLTRRRSSTSPR